MSRELSITQGMTCFTKRRSPLTHTYQIYEEVENNKTTETTIVFFDAKKACLLMKNKTKEQEDPQTHKLNDYGYKLL